MWFLNLSNNLFAPNRVKYSHAFVGWDSPFSPHWPRDEWNMRFLVFGSARSVLLLRLREVCAWFIALHFQLCYLVLIFILGLNYEGELFLLWHSYTCAHFSGPLTLAFWKKDIKISKKSSAMNLCETQLIKAFYIQSERRTIVSSKFFHCLSVIFSGVKRRFC